MAHVVEAETEAVNADSFLDIVASVVSVMIIMVLMVGLRIKNTPVAVPTASIAAAPNAALAQDAATEQSLRQDVLKTAAEMEGVTRQAFLRKQQRDRLAVLVTSVEQKLDASHGQLEGQSREDLDLQRKVSEAKFELEQLGQARVALESAPAEAIQVESYPTPLSHLVDGNELHFQLRAGRLAQIPMARLLTKFKSDAEHQLYKLHDRSEFTESTAPEGGFYVRYTIERKDITAEEAVETHRHGTRIETKLIRFIPVSDDIGETVEEALRENSQFRLALTDVRPSATTITIWTYPDSFAAFRLIKKELFRLGFATAGRPLPEGTPISGSPEGSKSAAE